MRVKLKKYRQTSFQLFKTCFQPVSSERLNFIDSFTRKEQKNLPNETLWEAHWLTMA